MPVKVFEIYKHVAQQRKFHASVLDNDGNEIAERQLVTINITPTDGYVPWDEWEGSIDLPKTFPDTARLFTCQPKLLLDDGRTFPITLHTINSNQIIHKRWNHEAKFAGHREPPL